jgi:hypothetical protein
VYYVVARGTKPWLVRAAEGNPCRRGSAQTTRGKPHSRACQAAYLIYSPNPGTGNARDSGWLATTAGVRVMARPGGTEQNPNKTYGVE